MSRKWSSIRRATAQLDLFRDAVTPTAQEPKPLLVVVDARPPCCGNKVAEVVPTPNKPHAAKLVCERCGGFRGWIKKDVFRFLIRTNEIFGSRGLLELKDPLARRSPLGSEYPIVRPSEDD